MSTEFLLPDLGEGLTDAEMVRWMVRAGDEVTLNQVICEVETAKALVELPSPVAGVVAAILVAEGETVLVGAPIISFGAAVVAAEVAAVVAGVVAAEVANEVANESAGVGPALEDDGRSNMLVGYGPGTSDHRSGHRRRRGIGAEVVATPGVLAKPPVRDLARRLGLDLTAVTGTGVDGAIIRSDVEMAGKSPAPLDREAAGIQATGIRTTGIRTTETRVPISGLRKRMAEAMVASAFTAPHVTEFVTVDVTETLELVQRLRAHPVFEGAKVTPLLVIAKAMAIATLRHPGLNSRLDSVTNEIVTFGAVNLGIAVATPRGLMVPNIRDVNSLTLRELCDALTGLASRARDGKTTLTELSGGTISITNVGSFGIDSGTPIINPGEAAILCTGAIRRQPWEFRDEIALRSVMTLSVSFDHRLVDGAEGSAFLGEIARILGDPLELIALG